MDWVHAHVPERARILTTLPELGLDRGRYEVLALDGYDERAAVLSPFVDVVATTQEQPGLEAVMQLLPEDPNAGPPVVLSRPAASRRLRPIALTPAAVTASESAARVPDMLDGDLASRW